MTSTERVWLTPQAYDRLQTELIALCSPRTAPDDTDVDAGVRRASRIRELHELLAAAVVGEDPPNDGVAEPGMVLTVRYDDTGDEDTFLLGMRDAERGELEVYSPTSPLGTALIGARPGEQRTYRVPAGALVPVTLLAAVPYGRHRAEA